MKTKCDAAVCAYSSQVSSWQQITQQPPTSCSANVCLFHSEFTSTNNRRGTQETKWTNQRAERGPPVVSHTHLQRFRDERDQPEPAGGSKEQTCCVLSEVRVGARSHGWRSIITSLTPPPPALFSVSLLTPPEPPGPGIVLDLWLLFSPYFLCLVSAVLRSAVCCYGDTKCLCIHGNNKRKWTERFKVPVCAHAGLLCSRSEKQRKQMETICLEPNAVAKRCWCQNSAHWLDLMVLPSNSCLVSTSPRSNDKKFDVYNADPHTHR